MKTSFRNIFLPVLCLLAGCSSPARQSASTARPVCDLTTLAYQSPQFVAHYFAPRQYADFSGAFDPSHRWTRDFEYSGSKASPGVLVTFYRGRVVGVVVFFFSQQTPEETLHRVGLNMADFKTVGQDAWKLELAGRSHGVAFDSLMLTNVSNQAKNGTWNIIAKFAAPGTIGGGAPATNRVTSPGAEHSAA